MDLLLLLQLVVVLLLVIGNAFFVASEIALTSARRSRIQHLADSGNGAAQIVQQLHAQPERFYSVTQVGITLVSLGLGAVGIVTVTKALEPVTGFCHRASCSVIPPDQCAPCCPRLCQCVGVLADFVPAHCGRRTGTEGLRLSQAGRDESAGGPADQLPVSRHGVGHLVLERFGNRSAVGIRPATDRRSRRRSLRDLGRGVANDPGGQ